MYLIDNCGRLVHSWQCSTRPGNTVYLEKDGTLYRAANVEDPQIQAGGGGGLIERYDWDNNLLWSYKYSSESFRAHHDFQVMPNGNVLILAWEEKNIESAVNAGRITNVLTGSKLWPEHIVEIKPTGLNSGELVWEWYLWDHLIQDNDPDKMNYGVVSENPGKIDINYIRPGHDGPDWIHANSIDYNSELDQILLSSNCFDEIWVIDHNITTSEAAGVQGDLLFRWGNPQTYRQGTDGDKQLFGQHSAHWIPQGLPDENKILIFNNGKGRPDDLYSSVVKIEPIIHNGKYQIDSNNRFLPITYDWEYTANPPTNFYSRIVSGAQQLPNGNILIDDGIHGTFFEITNSGETVWKYINPVTTHGIATQGDSVEDAYGEGINVVFRIHKYPFTYRGFEGKDLSPGDPIEGEPNSSLCITLSAEETESNNHNIFPNPSNGTFTIQGNSKNYTLFNQLGEKIISNMIPSTRKIEIPNVTEGLYFLKMDSGVIHKVYIQH